MNLNDMIEQNISENYKYHAYDPNVEEQENVEKTEEDINLMKLIEDSTPNNEKLVVKLAEAKIVQPKKIDFEKINVKKEECKLELKTVLLKDWISTNHDKLQYVEKIDLDQIPNLSGISDNMLFLKSINSDKDIIQLYKNIEDYHIFDIPSTSMSLLGENGFKIIYEPINNYIIKLYGAKTAIYITICIRQQDKIYPIHHMKSSKNKLTDHVIDCISINDLNILLDNNENFDMENYMIMYPPIYKTENLNNKRDVLSWLINKSDITNDVPHNVKLDNVMIKILRN